MKWILTGAFVGLVAALIGVAAMLSREGASTREYDHAEPALVIEAAVAMVEAGDAERLHELIYADSGEMRSVLMRLGSLLGNVQTLAKEINEEFPEEVAELRARAESNEAAARISQAFAGGGMGRRDGRRPDREDAERASQDLLRLLLADPYGWIARNKDRVTAVKTADDTAAIMIDGKPALGVGLLMKRDNGRWRIVLPLTFPGVARFTPQNREEWEILASIITVFDNAVVELASDVRAGRAASLADVSRLAGEKAAIPVFICFIAYERAMNARGLGAGAAP